MKPLLFTLFTLTGFLFISSFTRPASRVYPAHNLYEDQKNPADTFPVPKGNKNMIFYVQRTHNINTIVYELNYNKDSTLNPNEPVHLYWIRYADKGERAELSYIQKEYAYGLTAELIDKEKQTFKLNFVSYKKKDIYLIRSKTSARYEAYMTINGKLSRLERIFAKIEGGTFWVPHITYVEIFGRDASGKTVTEKIIP